MSDPIINPFSTLLTDPVRNFRFLVKFHPKETNSKKSGVDFNPAMGFVSVSGLTTTTESIQYREGGYNTTVHQIPGMTTFVPLTFSRGVSLGNNQSVRWMRQLFAVTSGSSVSKVGTDFRCDIEINVLSHPNPAATKTATGGRVDNPHNMHTSLRFKVYNAWISSLSFGDLSSGESALMVEQMQVQHEGWDVRYASNYNASASKFSW